jgi:hypothetical protein
MHCVVEMLQQMARGNYPRSLKGFTVNLISKLAGWCFLLTIKDGVNTPRNLSSVFVFNAPHYNFC